MGEIANGGENLFGNNENNLGINSAENQLFCQAAAQKLMIELDAEMQFLFLKIKNEVGKNLSNKETLRQILKQYEDISSKFSKIKSVREIQPPQPVQPVSAPQSPPQKSLPGENFPKNLRSARSARITRYIPAQQKRITLSQTQNHCAYPNCQRPPEILHHRDRFAVSQNHDSVIPLCKIHHEFAHNGIIAEEQKPPTNWQFKLSDLKAQNSEAAKTDFLYRSYRNS